MKISLTSSAVKTAETAASVCGKNAYAISERGIRLRAISPDKAQITTVCADFTTFDRVVTGCVVEEEGEVFLPAAKVASVFALLENPVCHTTKAGLVIEENGQVLRIASYAMEYPEIQHPADDAASIDLPARPLLTALEDVAGFAYDYRLRASTNVPAAFTTIRVKVTGGRCLCEAQTSVTAARTSFECEGSYNVAIPQELVVKLLDVCKKRECESIRLSADGKRIAISAVLDDGTLELIVTKLRVDEINTDKLYDQESLSPLAKVKTEDLRYVCRLVNSVSDENTKAAMTLGNALVLEFPPEECSELKLRCLGQSGECNAKIPVTRLGAAPNDGLYALRPSMLKKSIDGLADDVVVSALRGNIILGFASEKEVGGVTIRQQRSLAVLRR